MAKNKFLPHVFSPITINKLELPNRIIMSSMHLNMPHEAEYQGKAAFYAARAANNVGLIITAGCSPNDEGRPAANAFSILDDSEIENHKIITDAVHEKGGLIALQLLHFGREAYHGRMVSASDVKLGGAFYTPKPLTEEEIWQTIRDYGEAARRAKEANYDAIELLFSQGYLLHQFLAPMTNKRDDQWGGTFANRQRICVEVAKAVREAVGPDFPIIFRIPCLDLLEEEEGLEFDNGLKLIESLYPYGIDLLSVSVGWHESKIPTIAYVAPYSAFSVVSKRIKSQFPDLKINLGNRIQDVREAEKFLADGIDIVSMARAFLADPYIMTKTKEGRYDDVNICIACNQDCLDRVFSGRVVGCAVNPVTIEAEPELKVLPRKEMKPVAVVGGGLAGLSSAYFLALNGYPVVLFEKDYQLGGQIHLAVKIPKKDDFLKTVNFYERQLLSLGVKIKLATSFDTNYSDKFTCVVMATGSSPNVIDLDLDESIKVLNYDELLEHDLPVDFPVVVLGAGGIACDVAKYLKLRNPRYEGSAKYLEKHLEPELFAKLHDESYLEEEREVTILQRSKKKVAPKLGLTTRWISTDALAELKVKYFKNCKISDSAQHSLTVTSKSSGNEKVIPVKTVIMCTGQKANDGLSKELSTKKVFYVKAGAVKPQSKISVSRAIHDGHEAFQRINDWFDMQ